MNVQAPETLQLPLSGTGVLRETRLLPQRNTAKPSNFFFIPEALRPTVQAKSALPAGESPEYSGLALPEGCSLPLQLINPASRYSHGSASPFSSLLWPSAFLGAGQKMPSSVFTSVGHFSAFQLKSNLISVVFESSAGLGRSNSQGAAFSLL